MKGQAGILEYIFMAFFVVFIIVILVLFLGWWNVIHIGAEQKKLHDDRAFFLLKHLMISQMLVRENSVFDDSRLTAMKRMEQTGTDICKKFSEIFGKNWYFRLRILDEDPDKECTFQNYPDCNLWSFCEPSNTRIPKYQYTIPVNVYRSLNDRKDLALLTAGVYS